MAGDRIARFLPRVAAVREDMAPLWEALVYRLEQRRHLDPSIGGMDEDHDHKAQVSVRIWRLRP
jgi:hypothetical protein